MASFENDIFISYAYLDNKGGWVDDFHVSLSNRLGVFGVTARIWRDRKLRGDDLFSEEILDQLKRSALLISIVSPNGLKSNWCEKERQTFERYAQAGWGFRIGNAARAFKVVMTPAEGDAHRPLFDTNGYEFFEKDPQTGRYDHYLPRETKFEKLIDQLAQDIKAKLQTVDAAASQPVRSEPGTIVTFYAYKGGTGRSMALANMAFLAAREVSPRRVLMIDWDLEAPGLNRYFPESEKPENANRPGLIDYFVRLAELLTPETYEKLSGRDGAGALESLLPLDDYITRDVGPSLDLIKAGRMDRGYPNRIASFDWVRLFRDYHRVYRAFRDRLAARYEWCFVDSRAGLSDTSGICTMLMPEKLVAVFTPNRQSLDGVINLSSRAIEYRRNSDDPRPLSVFPLPSRIVTDENKFLQGAQERYRKVFEECLQGAYELKTCNLGAYFEEVAIPHKGFYGFDEMVALRDDPSATDVLSINRAYERFWRRLVALDAPWIPCRTPSARST